MDNYQGPALKIELHTALSISERPFGWVSAKEIRERAISIVNRGRDLTGKQIVEVSFESEGITESYRALVVQRNGECAGLMLLKKLEGGKRFSEKRRVAA